MMPLLDRRDDDDDVNEVIVMMIINPRMIVMVCNGAFPPSLHILEKV